MGDLTSYGPNRYVCSVLDEMRNILLKLDKDSLERYQSIQAMLIEEAQTMVNRMEAALEDQDDFNKMNQRRKIVKKELKALEEQLELVRAGEEDD